ncbi:MAG: hypothetical protein LH480_11815 [Rubrivivax sp.]|nr:hypothetical protein [Rubrivivax sp.]
MNSVAPRDIWRSEAFAEDLDDSAARHSTPRQTRLSTTVLCVLPVAVAIVGGVLAYINTLG